MLKKKKKAKAENPIEWFFFHFFNLSIFVSLEMFTIHQKNFIIVSSNEPQWSSEPEVIKKMEWIYLNQGENMGVSHYYVFAFLGFIFQTST